MLTYEQKLDEGARAVGDDLEDIRMNFSVPPPAEELEKEVEKEQKRVADEALKKQQEAKKAEQEK